MSLLRPSVISSAPPRPLISSACLVPLICSPESVPTMGEAARATPAERTTIKATTIKIVVVRPISSSLSPRRSTASAPCDGHYEGRGLHDGDTPVTLRPTFGNGSVTLDGRCRPLGPRGSTSRRGRAQLTRDHADSRDQWSSGQQG